MKKGNDIPKLYDENDNLLVLVSRGYGAGFSTWICKEVCYDARIVGAFIDNKSADYVAELIKSRTLWGSQTSLVSLQTQTISQRNRAENVKLVGKTYIEYIDYIEVVRFNTDIDSVPCKYSVTCGEVRPKRCLAHQNEVFLSVLEVFGHQNDT